MKIAKFRSVKLFLALTAPAFLQGCLMGHNATCPEPLMYSREFQNNLARDLEEHNKVMGNSYYLNQAIIDLYNLNNELKEYKNKNGL